VVLPPQRRRRPPLLFRQGVEGQGRLLAPRGFPAFAPDAAGLAPGRIEGPGGRRPDCGVRPHEPPSPADRPHDGEAAPHLRDARGRGPRCAGAVTVAAGPLPAGVRGHPGAARHRPQGRPERRRGPLGIHHAPRRLVATTFLPACSTSCTAQMLSSTHWCFHLMLHALSHVHAPLLHLLHMPP
jgi:hypothetical protein